MEPNAGAKDDEVIAAVREMNRLWTETWDEKGFARFIHPDAVAIAPTTPGRLEGKEAYVAGWKGFVQAVKIHEWKISGHRVNFFSRGSCAVLSYFCTIRFSMNGQEVVDRKSDV